MGYPCFEVIHKEKMKKKLKKKKILWGQNKDHIYRRDFKRLVERKTNAIDFKAKFVEKLIDHRSGRGKKRKTKEAKDKEIFHPSLLLTVNIEHVELISFF